MASLLSEFHFHASQLPAHFDYEHEKFDVKDIYNFYHLKVRLLLIAISIIPLPHYLFI